MTAPLKPIVTWPNGWGSEVVLEAGRIRIRPNGVAFDSESDLIYRALLAARRARRAKRLDLP
jgi:hypothetical protein